MTSGQSGPRAERSFNGRSEALLDLRAHRRAGLSTWTASDRTVLVSEDRHEQVGVEAPAGMDDVVAAVARVLVQARDERLRVLVDVAALDHEPEGVPLVK